MEVFRKMPRPVFVSRRLAQRLIDEGDISFDPINGTATWFGSIYVFSSGQSFCFERLWENLLFRGNLPLTQGRVLSAWRGSSTHLSDIFKRHSTWKTVIVGDGKGRVWLHIPEELLVPSVEEDNSPTAEWSEVVGSTQDS